METSAPRFEDIRWDISTGIRRFEINLGNNSIRTQITAGVTYNIYVDRVDNYFYEVIEKHLHLNELEARCVYIDLVKRYFGGNFRTQE